MMNRLLCLVAVLGFSPFALADSDLSGEATIENQSFAVSISKTNGAIISLTVKALNADLLGEKRLASNFRISLPLPDYQCHYIEGAAQHPKSVQTDANSITVTYEGMTSEKGSFPIDLSYSIRLDNDSIRFTSRLTNNDKNPVAEFWFPRLGGWNQCGDAPNPLLATPNYIGCANSVPFFNYFPGGRGLGAEAPEFSTSYPGMVMPWWDFYDAKTDVGLYFGYHDETMRLSTWHAYLYPNVTGRPDRSWMTQEEAGGEPIGLEFSHVRYPYVCNGETFESGEFVLSVHKGDWREGSLGYRKWFMEHFPFDKSDSWLRKESAWFTSIIYQPEDKLIADYKTYDQWTKDAAQFGVHCCELIGWDKGGIERDYPAYVPEEKLGGWDAFRELMRSMNEHGSKPLIFANYNVMDSNTDWYKQELQKFTHQDTFGKTPNWMAWGESTLAARLGLNVRRHVLASVVPEFEQILEKEFVDIAKAGGAGLQLDKVVAGSALDFNPLNKLKPDTALCEGLVQAIGQARAKCREVNPAFCIASEASQDRLIPYVDVFYRCSSGFDISPLRYVFPEWTSCQHVSTPGDFNGVNGAVLTGSVICLEPDSYQNSLGSPQYRKLGEYVKETTRIRSELADYIFLGKYHDTIGGLVQEVTQSSGPSPAKYLPNNTGALPYKIHGHKNTDQRVLLVANTSTTDRLYFWEFSNGEVEQSELYEPWSSPRMVKAGEPVTIKGLSFQALIELPSQAPEGLRLDMRCGAAGKEVRFASEGFDAVVKEGFTSAWGPCWIPPTYHCRAHEKELCVRVKTPVNAQGKLRLYMIDPDRFFGGRVEEVFVDDASLGVVENFQEGRWLERDITPEQTADGEVIVKVRNMKQDGNCVLSKIEWVDK